MHPKSIKIELSVCDSRRVGRPRSLQHGVGATSELERHLFWGSPNNVVDPLTEISNAKGNNSKTEKGPTHQQQQQHRQHQQHQQHRRHEQHQRHHERAPLTLIATWRVLGIVGDLYMCVEKSETYV